MSIFTLPVHSVENTRIYISSSQRTPDRQLTMISQTIETMIGDIVSILPVPHPHSVQVHRLERGTGREFLDELEKGFDQGRYVSRVTPSVFASQREDPRIPRGEYNVLFVGTKEEFQDYNTEHEVAHPHLVAQLASLYKERYWGFLVVSIQEGYCAYDPLVYSHQMEGPRFFVPTLHHYPETIRDQTIQEESTRWDHTLFLNGTYSEDDSRFQEINPMRLNRIPWGVLPKGFGYALRHLVMKKMRGYGQNLDMTAESRIHADQEGRLRIDE